MRKLGLILAMLAGTAAFLAGCAPAAQNQQQDQGSSLYTIGFIVVIFAIFYFLMIRPQRKRQKDHQRLVQELQKGDHVVTAGGIYGVIDGMDDDTILIKVESGAMLRVSKSSVIGIRNP